MCPVCEGACSLGNRRCVQYVSVCSLGDGRCVQHVRGVFCSWIVVLRMRGVVCPRLSAINLSSQSVSPKVVISARS